MLGVTHCLHLGIHACYVCQNDGVLCVADWGNIPSIRKVLLPSRQKQCAIVLASLSGIVKGSVSIFVTDARISWKEVRVTDAYECLNLFTHTSYPNTNTHTQKSITDYCCNLPPSAKRTRITSGCSHTVAQCSGDRLYKHRIVVLNHSQGNLTNIG